MPFPLADGAGSPVLEDIVAGPAAALTAVALVVGPGARASGWAARAAIALAQRWRGPRRVLLADLDLVHPALHEAAGVANDEGVIDLIDYGISLGRLIRSVPGGTFDLLPAGIFTPAPADILRHDGWGRVLMEVAARRGTLLAWVPADAEGADRVIDRAGAVLVLAEAEEAHAIVERLAHPYAVLAILTPEIPPAEAPTAPESEPAEAAAAIVFAEAPAEPPAPEAPEPAPTEPVFVLDDDAAASLEDAARAEETPVDTAPIEAPVPAAPPPRLARTSDEEFERIRLPRDAAAREALIAELRERQRAARLAGAAPAGETREEPTEAVQPDGSAGPPHEPPPVARPTATPPVQARAPLVMPVAEAAGKPPRRGKRYMRPLLWTVGVVLLASLLAGAWHFLSGRLRPVEPAVAVPVPEPQPATPAPAIQNALPYVVAIEAHRDLLTALERVSDLEEIEPELLFHVETLERDGALFYHVMAGPVSDSAAALALRDTLISRGHKTGPTPTDVRSTPLAFLIGDYGTADVAEQQRDVLRRLDIPGYVLQGRAADGQPLYRLYVGGFGTEAESDIVGQLLRAAGIRDSLVTRTGSTIVTDSLVTPTDSSNP